MGARLLATATTAAVVTATAFIMYRRRRKMEATEEDDAEEIPYVTRDQVVLFFEKINTTMQKALVDAQMQFQQYQGQVPEDQLMQFLCQNFETRLEEEQSKLLAAWDLDESDMEQATAHYASDPAVSRGVKILKQMHAALSGRVDDVELPADFSEQQFIEVIERYYQGMVDVMRICMVDLNLENQPIGSHQQLEQLQELFQERLPPYLGESLSPYRFTPEMMPLAQRRFQDSMAVQRAFAEGALRQRAGFAELGIAM